MHDYEYVAVYFKGDCLARDSAKPDDSEAEDDVENEKEDVDCEEVLAELETIDDDLREIGIIFVTTEDTEVATTNGECSPLLLWPKTICERLRERAFPIFHPGLVRYLCTVQPACKVSVLSKEN